MRITAALLAAILFFQSSAFGQFTIVELAHEVPLDPVYGTGYPERHA